MLGLGSGGVAARCSPRARSVDLHWHLPDSRWLLHARTNAQRQLPADARVPLSAPPPGHARFCCSVLFCCCCSCCGRTRRPSTLSARRFHLSQLLDRVVSVGLVCVYYTTVLVVGLGAFPAEPRFCFRIRECFAFDSRRRSQLLALVGVLSRQAASCRETGPRPRFLGLELISG